MKSKATAIWTGGLKDGKGALTTGSGVLSNTPYTFATRFEGAQGLNPEELIAAAHSGCFAMAFSMILGLAGFPPSKIQAQATVTLEKVGDGFSVTSSHLDVEASVPGISESAFKEAADKAKANCPISKLLKAEITMDARLAA